MNYNFLLLLLRVFILGQAIGAMVAYALMGKVHGQIISVYVLGLTTFIILTVPIQTFVERSRPTK